MTQRIDSISTMPAESDSLLARRALCQAAITAIEATDRSLNAVLDDETTGHISKASDDLSGAIYWLRRAIAEER